MQLSEAIRLGSSLHPQHFGAYCAYSQEEVYATCALGAVSQAIGVDVYSLKDSVSTFLIRKFPILNFLLCNHFTVFQEIVGMNDTLKKSREEIADWVEGLEKLHPELCVKEETKEIVLEKVLA